VRRENNQSIYDENNIKMKINIYLRNVVCSSEEKEKTLTLRISQAIGGDKEKNYHSIEDEETRKKKFQVFA
jgi:hypothetical protein